MAQDPTEPFKESLKLHVNPNMRIALPPNINRYCNAATFSDAVIRCGEKEFKAHRLVLSSHSAFFSKMCTGNWKACPFRKTLGTACTMLLTGPRKPILE